VVVVGCRSRSRLFETPPHTACVCPQEYDELVEMQVKLEEKIQELEANPPR